jgi:hypothetical protein
MIIHKISLPLVFLIEVFAPFLYLFGTSHLYSCMGLAATALLQIAIWLSGNYATFNLLTINLCIPLFLQDLSSYFILHYNTTNSNNIFMYNYNTLSNLFSDFVYSQFDFALLAPLYQIFYFFRLLFSWNEFYVEFIGKCLSNGIGGWLELGYYIAIFVVFIIYFIGGLLCLPWSSFSTGIWLYTMVILREFPFSHMTPLLNFYRLLSPFHIVHGYGIFGPHSPPRVLDAQKEGRAAITLQGYDDKLQTWLEYKYKYQICSPQSKPKFFAPYQPRLDHVIWYEAFAMRPSDYNYINPYSKHNRYHWLHRLMQRLVEGDEDVLRLFESSPFDPLKGTSAKPSKIRAMLYRHAYCAKDDQRRKAGTPFIRTYSGLHDAWTGDNPKVFRLSKPSQFACSWWRKWGLDTWHDRQQRKFERKDARRNKKKKEC